MIYKFVPQAWYITDKLNTFIFKGSLRQITLGLTIAIVLAIIFGLIYHYTDDKHLKLSNTCGVLGTICAIIVIMLGVFSYIKPSNSYLPDALNDYGTPNAIVTANGIGLNMHKTAYRNPFKPFNKTQGYVLYKNKPIIKNTWHTYDTVKLTPLNNIGKALINVTKYDHNKHANFSNVIKISHNQVKLHNMYDKNASGFKEITVTAKINKPNTLHVIKQTHNYTTNTKTVRETKTINE